MPVQPLIASVKLPAGTYIIGDPCYHVPEDAWSELLDSVDYFEKQCYGAFKKSDGTLGTVVSFGTKYGDGCYEDQAGRRYGVDAGMIGIIPAEDVGDFGIRYPPGDTGHRIEFRTDFECWEDGGTIHFGDIVIHTGDDNDTDSED